MKTFNRDNKSGNRRGGKEFGRRDSGGRNYGGGKPSMHKAICSDCGKECEVPFRPTGDRPIFCSSCFGKRGSMSLSRPGARSYERPDFEHKRMFEAVCDKCGNKCEVPFRPAGGKPVYCSQCFDKGGSRGGKDTDQYKEQFEMFCDYCFEIKLLNQKDGYFFSDSLCQRMKHIDEIRERLSDAGKKGADIRWGSYSHPIAGEHGNPIAIKESKVKESKVNNKSIVPNTSFLDSLKNNLAYKHIDVGQELAKMDAWLLVHKGRKKTPKFVVAWLNRIDKPLEPEKLEDNVRKL